MIYDVVSAAELIFVKLKIQLVRIGERNSDFPEHLNYLFAPVVDVA